MIAGTIKEKPERIMPGKKVSQTDKMQAKLDAMGMPYFL
jgi:hypothetical protein